MIGTTLAHYEILEKLGEGAMGEVYVARDRKLGRKVALKMLPQPMADHPDHLRRFEQEAKAIAALNHPNIVTIFAVEEVGQQRFFTMELVAGETLKSFIRAGGLPLLEFLDVALPIADALEAARQQGVVHRDLKPSNIMVGADGRVKVLDFGLAKLRLDDVEQLTDDTLTREGSMLGTVPYMSPEQVEGLELDHRSDIFSFGILLYELATGQRPFQADSWARLITSILRDEPRSVTALRPSLPQRLSQIIGRCLKKDRARRYQEARELRQHLAELKTSSSSSVEIAIRPAPAAPAERSIAVLPFVNLSADPEQEYFADGLAEELINALGRLQELRVAARTSSFLFRGRDADIREIGEELNVATVLEGSVRKSGERLRITAQLVEAASGYHLWSERYDRKLDDIFAVQDEIARTIAETLKLKLIDEPSQLVRRYTYDMDAYNAYLRGRFYWNRREAGALEKSLRSFQEAIERDPSFALAYTGLADALNTLAFYNFIAPREGFPKGKAAAQKALELDDSLAEAHTSLAWATTFHDWDWQTGERAFQRALELDPAYGTAHLWYCFFLMAMGRLEESAEHIGKAKQAEPLSMITNGAFSFLMYHTRNFERGIEEAKKTLDLDPTFGPGYSFLGWNYAQTEAYDRAIDAWLRSLELMPDNSLSLGMLGYSYARCGREEEAREILERLTSQTSDRYVSSYFLACLHVGLGDERSAFDRLHKAREERNNFLVFSRTEPVFDPLRKAPEFKTLLADVGLEATA